MLPRMLYEALPYLYLATGLAGGLLVESSLIMIASMLLISVGLVTIYMRCQHRCPAEARPAKRERRSGLDRRQRDPAGFPLSDHRGDFVVTDRRAADRRCRQRCA